MYGVPPQAYDRATSVFSPDGSLYQVEYAKEAVKRGATAFGLIFKEGVILGAHKPISSPLVVEDSLKKVFLVDEHVLISASGVIADARRLIDYARLVAQRYRLLYEEPVPPFYLAGEIGEVMQSYTQVGGLRPFGVAFILGGLNRKKPELFEIVPSGAITGYRAVAIGKEKKHVEKVFEKRVKPEKAPSQREALRIVGEALKGIKAGPHDRFEVVVLGPAGVKFLSEKEIARLRKR